MKTKDDSYPELVCICMADVRPTDSGVRIDKKTREIIIEAQRFYPDGYTIDIDQYRTPADILGLIDHLAGKRWMTVEKLHYVIEYLTKYYGIEIHR